MNPTAEPARVAAPTSSAAIDNLRAVVILLVIAFHAVLAYLSFLPGRPFAFDSPPYLWRAFPVVDPARWPGFDLFCAWLDVFLMSFFFLLSGLFAWPSLARRGPAAFLAGRLERLGLPFVVIVPLLMPLTLYPIYLQTAADPSLGAYWRHWLALPFWPSGPLWFLWLLLLGDAAAAGLYCLLGDGGERVERLSRYARRHSARFLAGFVGLSALAYIPLALAFGTSAWGQWGPFALQLGRPAHYALYFLAGVAIGACGIERGLLAVDGTLPRHWRRWAIAAAALFTLWLALTAATLDRAAAGPVLLALADLSFVLACFASTFGVLALALRCAAIRWRRLASLRDSAYGMYLVHYLFIVWLQYALLPFGLPAAGKAAIVFAGTVLASWGATLALCRVPAIAEAVAGRKSRAGAAWQVTRRAKSPHAAGLAD